MADKTPAAKLAPPDLYIHWFKENFEAVVVAYVMALFIRCFFVEVFQIPTSSMEPTLRGDTKNDKDEILASGDRIMVSKFYYGLSKLERYDVAIFRMPLNQPKVFIKRCVGLSGETWCMYKGNIYTRPPGEPNAPLKIARKTLDKMEETWIPVHFLGDAARNEIPPYFIASYLADVGSLYSVDADFKKFWTVPEGTPSVVMPGRLRVEKIRKDADAEFTVRQRIQSFENRTLDDLLLQATFSVDDASGAFSFALRNGYGRFLLTLSTNPKIPGELRWLDGDDDERKTVKLATPTIVPGRDHVVKLMVFDGQCFAYVDNALEAQITFLEILDDAEKMWKDPMGPGAAFTSHGLPFTMTELRLGRDVHYCRRNDQVNNIEENREGAFEIPAGHYLFLGDNTMGSFDGRSWLRHTFELKSGETIVCESFDLEPKHLSLMPHEHITVGADIYGDRYEFDGQDVKHHTVEPYPTVPEGFILGRAFWVWWPKAPGKVRLIR